MQAANPAAKLTPIFTMAGIHSCFLIRFRDSSVKVEKVVNAPMRPTEIIAFTFGLIVTNSLS